MHGRLIGQRQFWRKPSVFAARSVSEGLYLTRPLANASGYEFGKSRAVQLSASVPAVNRISDQFQQPFGNMLFGSFVDGNGFSTG